MAFANVLKQRVKVKLVVTLNYFLMSIAQIFLMCAVFIIVILRCNLWKGIIDRDATEALLQDKPSGSYLIRVSDKIWGYAISFKGKTRCKHFLIDAGDSGYQFFGLYHVLHASLVDLVKYHEVRNCFVSITHLLLDLLW